MAGAAGGRLVRRLRGRDQVPSGRSGRAGGEVGMDDRPGRGSQGDRYGRERLDRMREALWPRVKVLYPRPDQGFAGQGSRGRRRVR